MSEESRKEIAAHIVVRKQQQAEQEAKWKRELEESELDVQNYNAIIDAIAWPAFREIAEDVKSQGEQARLIESKEHQFGAELVIGHSRCSIYKSGTGELTLSRAYNSAPIPRKIPYKELTKDFLKKELLEFVKQAL